MHVSARSYLTAGVAALSATAIAMAPVQPLNQDSPLSTQRVSAALAVNLGAWVGNTPGGVSGWWAGIGDNCVCLMISVMRGCFR